MRALTAVLGLLVSSVAFADDPPPAQTPPPIRQVRLIRGESDLLHLDAPAGVGICDDTSIVRVEDAGDALRLVGLKTGKTLCGFWTQATKGQHVMVEVVVVDPPRTKPPAPPPGAGG